MGARRDWGKARMPSSCSIGKEKTLKSDDLQFAHQISCLSVRLIHLVLLIFSFFHDLWECGSEVR